MITINLILTENDKIKLSSLQSKLDEGHISGQDLSGLKKERKIWHTFVGKIKEFIPHIDNDFREERDKEFTMDELDKAVIRLK